MIAMTDFSRAEIKALVEEQIPPCVSMYLPIGRTEIQPLQGPTRLKTLLNRAEKQLQEMGSNKQEIETVLQPIGDLLQNEEFWQQPRQGLAIFSSLSPDAFRTFDDTSEVVQFVDTVVVGENFHLKPLIPLLSGDRSFYVLAVTRDHAGLLKGNRDHIRPVNDAQLPETIDTALGTEVSGFQMQGRPMNVGGGEQTGVFGAPDPMKYEQDRVLRYCRAVDEALHQVLAGRTEPLIVAALPEWHAVYRAANTYPYLASHGIEKDADTMTAEELHDAAWPLVAPFFQQEISDAVERYQRDSAVNPGIASNQLADILQAAHFARVDTLFIADGYEQYGHYDPTNAALDIYATQQPGSIDLIDQAVTHVILNCGHVFTLNPDEMPDSPAIAAIYRF
jgi:hypothetical protein